MEKKKRKRKFILYLLSSGFLATEIQILRELRLKKNRFLFDGMVATLLLIACLPPLAYGSIPDDAAYRVVIGEAANQGDLGMQAVAEVIRRRGSLDFFSASHRPDLERFVQAQGPRILKAAKAAWEKSRTSNITKGATHYENVEAFGEPWWASRMVKTVRIKDHQFYREVR